jgi:hypothetical protein
MFNVLLYYSGESYRSGPLMYSNKLYVYFIASDPALVATATASHTVAKDDESDEESESDDDPDVVSTWIEALNAMGADPDEDELNYDDQWYYDQMGGDDGLLDDDDDDGTNLEDEQPEEPAEDPPEKREDPMEPLPDYNIPNYRQENGEYLSTKRYLRNDKMRLDRFMELADITSTNLDDPAIDFPELYEIYS